MVNEIMFDSKLNFLVILFLLIISISMFLWQGTRGAVFASEERERSILFKEETKNFEDKSIEQHKRENNRIHIILDNIRIISNDSVYYIKEIHDKIIDNK